MATDNRRGFTLVELLVVIAIIGILMGIALPAINYAREMARRTQCSNNLRGLAMGSLSHETSKKQFPGYMQYFGRFPTGVDPSNPNPSAPPVTAHAKIGTWGVALLPFLDQQGAYEFWSEDRYPVLTWDEGGALVYDPRKVPNVDTYICPSDINNGVETTGKNSYVVNTGFWVSSSDLSATPALISKTQSSNNGIFNNKYSAIKGSKDLGLAVPPSDFPLGDKVSQEQIRDGRSQTILFSENLQADRWHRINFQPDGALPNAGILTSGGPHDSWLLGRVLSGIVWHYLDDEQAHAPDRPTPGLVTGDAPYRINGQKATRRIQSMQEIYQNGYQSVTGVDAAALFAAPSSMHTDGVNASFADGGVRFLSQRIDYRVYQALLTPRGKASDVPFYEFVIKDDEF